MGKLTIKQGRHRPFKIIPACFREIPFQYLRIPQVRYVKFTPSCRYDLGDEDQKDWNKLFGFCCGISGVHKDSARVVWRYNKDTDMIELGLYCYIDGERIFPKKIISVNIDEDVTIKLGYSLYEISLNIITDNKTEWVFEKSMVTCDKGVRYGCGLYFGGNRTAPQDITIEYTKG